MIGYFSMKIALDPDMPTYSGGLGILAGDTIRAAADREVPMAAITLLHRKGYFFQKLDANGWQTEEPAEWTVEDFLQEIPQRAAVTLEGRRVQIRAWKYEVVGLSGFRIPVCLLDTDLPENSDWDRTLTHYLYGGDNWYRLCQEIVLGIGGVRMLRALGCTSIERFHMNEGHAAFLMVELLFEEARNADRKMVIGADIEAVRRKCIFTTHTPVPAGHDQFPMEMVAKLLSWSGIHIDMKDVGCVNLANHVIQRPGMAAGTDTLNMTYLALNLSHYVNGVAKKHAEISRHMFAEYQVDAITNGVHVATWASPPFQTLFDRHIPSWRDDSFSLRYALGVPPNEIWEAHCEAKAQLIDYVNHETNIGMEVHDLTLGFARRAATYKRSDLLFHDIERLKLIISKVGRFQVIYAGKAHPQDQGGKELIRRVFQAKEVLKDHIKIVYLANYDWKLARLMTAGADVWLNTPLSPLEASGTSGMKAAINGVPSLSILDGWWIEGCIEGVTGWAIGERTDTSTETPEQSGRDAALLYEKLEQVVIPTFYRDRDRFLDIMRHAIALNGSFFNTQRMVLQYVLKAYFR